MGSAKQSWKSVTPFVKWAGGKRQLMDSIMKMVPQTIKNHVYVEPFVGGGSVFFHIRPEHAIINDLNSELINAYTVVRENADELIEKLKQYENSPDYFYKIRQLSRKESNKNRIDRASMFIYLNKTCYNGLYRVNSTGEFNSPFGKYKNPNIVNEPVLQSVASYLKRNTVKILNMDYMDILKGLDTNAFVYLDPPYHPISKKSNFTNYIKGGWNKDEQIRLRKACDGLTDRGIKFLLSNSASEFIKNQYEDYHISIVKATRAINSNASKRGEIEEFLIRNY